MRIGILKGFDDKYKNYVKACKDLNVDYEIINIISSDWSDKIKHSNANGFLVTPASFSDVQKSLYEERVYFINKIMKLPIYPSYDEIFIYESKRNMAYWLQIKDVKHPKTWIFYDKIEAIDFAENHTNFPIVFKPNIGSAGIGVRYLNNVKDVTKLINKVFTKYRFFNTGLTKWYKTKYRISYPLMDDRQYNNILFQEKINVKHEWRGIKIGESYFAHKKIQGEDGFHSGSGKANYDTPPIEVMNFIKVVCDMGRFNSMNVDFFEDHNGEFYVNELQTLFGSKIKPYQMCVNGKPGRYRFIGDTWVFEEGLFNQNNSFNLRVKDFLNQIKKI